MLLLAACQPAESTSQEQAASVEIDRSKYPENFQNILKAHGSLERWNKMQFLSYERVNSAGNEVHRIALKNRIDKIEAPNFKMGYDGENYWVLADTSFKRNPIFYHNLMFYFYAMPFVLADEGIQYAETDPLVYDSISYPGVAMSFNEGVGSSPKDDYIIYYNPETYQMEWLAYTATYFSQEKSTKFSYIRYNDWSDRNGVVLPNSLTWYRTNEDGKPTEARNNVKMENIQIMETAPAEGTFTMPAGAKVVTE